MRPRLLTPEQVRIALLLYDVGHPWSLWPATTGVPPETVLRSFRLTAPPARLVDDLDDEYPAPEAS